MFCPYCGHNLEQEKGICPQCGKNYDFAALRESPQPPESPPSPQPQAPPVTPGPVPPPPYQYYVQDKPSGLAVAALVTGILSVLCCCVPSILPIILGIIEIINIRNGNSSQKGYSYAMAGLILGIIGMAIAALSFLFFTGLRAATFPLGFHHPWYR